MLENIDLSVKLSKKKYKSRMPVLQDHLHLLQRACWRAQLASIIVFEGWDAAGKGTAIGKLTQRLEPRGFDLNAIREPRTYETHMPWLWRFWLVLPNYGHMAIFDRSWYGKIMVERVEGQTRKSDVPMYCRDILSFERTLADDKYIFIKFFMHISKKEQKKRFKKLESDPSTAWHVEPEDWEHHRHYEQYLVAIEEILEQTESEWAPWTIVEATDRRWARAKIFETVIRRLERGLQRHGAELPEYDVPEVIDEGGVDED